MTLPEPTTDLHVVALRPDTAAWWVESGPPMPNPEEATAQVRDFLSAGHPGALLAVVQGVRPLARLQASPIGSCGIGLYAAGFREGLDEGTLERAAGLLLDGCLALREQYPQTRYLETDVPSTAPLPGAWRSALVAKGLREVAETHTYELALKPGARPAGLQWQAVSDMPLDAVREVYEAAYTDTADASHQDSPENFAVRLSRLMEIPLLAPDYSSWLIASEGGRAVGLVFASLEREPYGSPSTGWIVEIGVLPQARGRGLGRVLLQAGLASLAERGAQRVLARIDVHNEPSIRLHERAGFVRLPGASWMYRRVWEAS